MSPDASPSQRLTRAQTGDDPPPLPIDEPGYHGMFMVGTQTLYLSHMPMFTMEKHEYQVVLRASLPPDAMQQYLAHRATDPTLVFNLSNSTDDPYALPELASGRRTSFKADLWADYSNAGAAPVDPPFLTAIPVQVEQIVHFRHFDFDIAHPAHLTYILFGTGGEAHLTHRISREPDFQHIVTLGAAPAWLSPVQIEASVELNVASLPSLPVPCRQPLTEQAYEVLFQGWRTPTFTLDLSGAATLWFSTGNLLNETDPCQRTAA